MQVEIELGARLGRSIAKSTTSTVTVPKPHEITFDIPIEKIVRENVKEAERKDSAMARSAIRQFSRQLYHLSVLGQSLFPKF